MGAADDMKIGAVEPHTFQKLIPQYSSKADYVLWFN
jgi:hypothetical protein